MWLFHGPSIFRTLETSKLYSNLYHPSSSFIHPSFLFTNLCCLYAADYISICISHTSRFVFPSAKKAFVPGARSVLTNEFLVGHHRQVCRAVFVNGVVIVSFRRLLRRCEFSEEILMLAWSCSTCIWLGLCATNLCLVVHWAQSYMLSICWLAGWITSYRASPLSKAFSNSPSLHDMRLMAVVVIYVWVTCFWACIVIGPSSAKKRSIRLFRISMLPLELLEVVASRGWWHLGWC